MDNFKLASKEKLRFPGPLGLLTNEQLWDIKLTMLDAMVVDLEDAITKTEKRSYLKRPTAANKLAKLRFDIALDILTTRVEEAEAEQKKAEDKEANAKLLDIIAKKKDSELENKSIEELEKMLR